LPPVPSRVTEDVIAEQSAKRIAKQKAETEKDDKAEEKADKAEKAEYAGAVRLEEGSTDAPDDDHLVKGNEDSMKYHVPGSRWYDATVAEVWFASAEDAEAAGFAPAGRAAPPAAPRRPPSAAAPRAPLWWRADRCQ